MRTAETTITTTLRLPHELYQWLRREADANRSSLNSEAIRSIRSRMVLEPQQEKAVR